MTSIFSHIKRVYLFMHVSCLRFERKNVRFLFEVCDNGDVNWITLEFIGECSELSLTFDYVAWLGLREVEPGKLEI